MQESSIEWTDESWNPLRGCTEIAPGCDHCYARTMAERFRGTEGHAFEQGFDLRLVPHLLTDPLRRITQKKIFVNSMSDLFHKSVPREYIKDIADVMCLAKWHIMQVLTKRSSRMRNLLQGYLSEAAQAPNIWWGVSVEDRKHGLIRIRHLQEATNAKVKWLSIEPLLEHLGDIDLTGINWVVVGGESGPGARPMEEEWVLSILAQCKEQRIPFFFKQWGGVHKGEAGRTLGNRIYSAFPKYREVSVPSNKERKAMIAQVKERVEYWLHDESISHLVFKKTEKQEEETVSGRFSLPLFEDASQPSRE